MTAPSVPAEAAWRPSARPRRIATSPRRNRSQEAGDEPAGQRSERADERQRDPEGDETGGDEHERAGERVDVPGAEPEVGPPVPGRKDGRAGRGGDECELADGNGEADRHPDQEVGLLLPKGRIGDHRLSAAPEAAAARRDGRMYVDVQQRAGERGVGPREQADRAAEADQERDDQRRDRQNADRRPPGDEDRERGGPDRHGGGEKREDTVGLRPEQKSEWIEVAHGCLPSSQLSSRQGCPASGRHTTGQSGVSGWG